MKPNKGQLSNLIWIGVILLIVFTPVGFHVKVFANRILSFAPKATLENERVLDSYDWRLMNQQGKMETLEAYRGEVLVINFWASWCPPCVAEMPSLVELHETFGDQVVFLFVAKDNPVKVKQYLEKQGFRIPLYYSATPIPAPLSSSSLPTTYIIDRHGRIAVEKVGAANWNSDTVHELLTELIDDDQETGKQ